MIREREKGENVKEKRKKGKMRKGKGRKGKEKDKMYSKKGKINAK
jgi:hypothetical protein